MDARCFIPPSAGKDCNVLLPVITAPSGNVGEVRFLGLGPCFTLWPLGVIGLVSANSLFPESYGTTRPMTSPIWRVVVRGSTTTLKWQRMELAAIDATAVPGEVSAKHILIFVYRYDWHSHVPTGTCEDSEVLLRYNGMPHI
jgi:hypothetical protein